MVSNPDLQDAVDQGIISQEQFDKLSATTAGQANDSALEALDEAPRFIRSFGDFFIAIGTCFLGAGLSAAIEFYDNSLFIIIAALIIVWLAAEWLTGYLRISAPSIVLALLFVGFAAYYGKELIGSGIIDLSRDGPSRTFFMLTSQVLMPSGITAMITAALFYARFRLPFTLALFGLATFFLLYANLSIYSTDFLSANFRLVIGVSGIVIFMAAMWFDTQDPLRKSRLSDCGFWLHLIAAPMLTHSILWDSHPAIISIKNMVGTINAGSSLPVIATFFVLFGIVALIINRRALLVSSLGYVGSIIAYGIWKLDLPSGAATSVVLLVIAGLIITFGVGWQPLRRLVFAVLPQGNYLIKLPPVHV